MAASAVVAEVPGESEAMEQTSAEAEASGEEPMQTECQGELGEGAAVRVVAIDEAAVEGTMVQVHVAMEAQQGQGDQAEVTPWKKVDDRVVCDLFSYRAALIKPLISC